jgi:hypothetical protein
MKRLTCLTLLTVLLLCGCQLDGKVNVAVDGNGGGTLALTLSADEELRAAATAADADPLGALEQAGGQLAGWEVTRSDRPGGDGAVTLSTRFRDADELERVSRDLAEGLAAPELSPLGPMRLTVDDETVGFDGTADLRVSAAVAELGLTPARARARLADAVRLGITARMPGAVLQTNADQRPDDRTVVWNITAGQRRSLHVIAERPWTFARVLAYLTRSGSLVVVLAAVLLVLLILAARAAAARRARGGAYEAFARSAMRRSRSLRT